MASTDKVIVSCDCMLGSLVPHVPPEEVTFSVKAPVEEFQLVTVPCMKLARNPSSESLRVWPFAKPRVVNAAVAGGVVPVFAVVPVRVRDFEPVPRDRGEAVNA